MTDKLTDEEERLLKRLAKPWHCMHPFSQVVDMDTHWHCTVCGLNAKKSCRVIYPKKREEDHD